MSLLLRYESAGAWGASSGLTQSDLARLGPTLDKLRDELCDVDERLLAGELAIPLSKQPLGSAFYALPATMLSQYAAGRSASPLGQMLVVTKQLMSEVDQIVVLGDRRALAGPKALMAACCQPYYNQLSRAARGSRPRVHFLGDRLDNDAVQGVMHLLGAHRQRAARGVAERWALVVVGQQMVTPAHTRLLPALLESLAVNAADDSQTLQRDVRAERTIWVTGDDSPLLQTARQIGSTHVISVPAQIGLGYTGLSMIGLVPAALLGINVMQLLEGAQAVSQHFSQTKSVENLVLQMAGTQHLLDQQWPLGPQRWMGWNRALGATGQWYRSLIGGSLQRELTVSSTAGSGSFEAGRPGWSMQVFSAGYRFDPLATVVDAQEEDLVQAFRGFRSAGWPTVSLSVPHIDEPSVGQLLQALMLSTVIAARLQGRNPYT